MCFYVMTAAGRLLVPIEVEVQGGAAVDAYVAAQLARKPQDEKEDS
jgi:chloramphenicol O-acetyltransferase